MTDFSAKALDEFLSYLGEKGLMPKATVVSRKAACNKMLAVLTQEERADLRRLDIDELSTRFQNLEGRNYTPDSMKTYKSRVSKAVEDFLRYHDNPAGFKVKPSQSRQPSAKAAKFNGSVEESTPKAQVSKAVHHGGATSGGLSGISIPVPIREDLVVQIVDVPFDLSGAEAQKIANVVLALAGGGE